jgi:hypothetical protein
MIVYSHVLSSHSFTIDVGFFKTNYSGKPFYNKIVKNIKLLTLIKSQK